MEGIISPPFKQLLMEESRDLVGMHLQNWRSDEVLWSPEIHDEELGDIVLWYTFEDGRKIPIAAKTETIGITGREKSRKSLLAQCMLMSKHTTDRNVTMGYSLMDKPLIYYFDTEQPKRRTKKNLKRFYEICGVKEVDQDYKVFNIKRYSHTQKLEIITHIIQELYEETGRYPDIIIVDQIGDLVTARDANDQLSSDMALNYVNSWIETTGAAFFYVIHTNRGGKETNGKLGALFDKKADCLFLIDINEENISTVIHRLARDSKMPTFTFRQDFSGTPRLLRTIELTYD